jgi:hypothetical protein
MIMRRLFEAMMYVAAITLLAVQPQAAQARREWPMFGGGLGDAGTTVQCPAGEAIVGFGVRAGAWMDQVRILCAKLEADGTFGEPHPGSDGVGGPGGAPGSAVCDRQSRMQDVTIDRSDDGKKVSTLGFHCVTKDGQQTGNIVGGSGSYCPSADRIIATGCDPGENATIQSCPNEQFVGAKIRFGKDVNAIGFICDQVAAVASSAPAPPAPSPTDTRAPIAVAQNVSIESTNFPGMFWRHQNWQGVLSKLSSDVDYKDAAFVEGPALTRQGKTAVSFESVEYPGYYLRHKNFVIVLEKEDGSQQFAQDASFNQIHRTGRGTAFESVNFPGMFIRHKDFKLRVDKDDGTEQFARDSAFKVDPPAGPPSSN